MSRTAEVEPRGGWTVRAERVRDALDDWQDRREGPQARRLLAAYYHFFRPTGVTVQGTIVRDGEAV